ncbi:MAG: DNA recombination protein RmuC [bacterium]
MEPSPGIIVLLALTALALLAVVGVLALTLARMRSLGEEVDRTRQEISDRLHQGQETALRDANEQVERVSKHLKELQESLGERLEGQRKVLDERLDASGKTVADLKKELGSLSEATKKLFDLGKDIASLEDILKSPKLRGGLGEIFLEKLLSDIFPRSLYGIQHSFADGTTVDAVIRIGDRMVPIDSKFPIEDFKAVLAAEGDDERRRQRKVFMRGVKKRVDEIADRYILPDEGTYDFALMYIPAENVYYETILREEEGEGNELLEYSIQRRVIPVSPNSFYAYLQVILFGLKGMELERRGNEILSHLRRIQGDLDKLASDYGRLGTHLKNARGAYEDGERRLTQVQSKVTGLESGAEELSLPPGSDPEGS